jgi:hypothetical protein
MQEDQHEEYFTSPERRRRTLWIVIAHVLVVGLFFLATFFWGNFG